MQLALITGGSRGLGHALCTQLLAQGWQVREFSRTAPHAYSVPIDLADPIASAATMAGTLNSLPSQELHSLLVINNAGTLAPMGPAAGHNSAALLANLHTNLATPVLLLAQIVAHFQALPCRKVLANISSGAAQKPYAGWSLYGAAKAGMELHMRCLAAEQHQQATPFLPVNIYPGVIDTDMQAAIRQASISDFPDRLRFEQRHTSGALQPPDRVAAAVLRIVALPALSAGERYEVAAYGA
jgi:benzil reductase ((S)-benzoin forming)